MVIFDRSIHELSPLKSEFPISRDLPLGSILLYNDDLTVQSKLFFEKIWFIQQKNLRFRLKMKMELEDWCQINAITTLPPEGLVSLP